MTDQDLPLGRDGGEGGAPNAGPPTNGDVGRGGGTAVLTKKDYASDQEVRWCPGCGDYAILAAFQSFVPELGIPPDDMVFVTGIGCSGRFVYYMNTYGIHSIHGRAPAVATGVATANPKLSVWIVTGDGDALSIGGNHLIHALRRNVNLKILMFNNQIYGLTKGQYSPTSEEGKVTKSTPFGSLDHPFNPVALALGAEATFVARSIDVDRQHLTDVLRAASRHDGTAFVEVYQNCNVFNDEAFIALTGKDGKARNQIRLQHGKPVTFGPDDEWCVAVEFDGTFRVAETADTPAELVYVHDAHHPSPAPAFGLAHLSHGPTTPTALGVFRDVERPVYGQAMDLQIERATERLGAGDLESLLHSGDTWTVG
jgi:2-oxoglutarate/2-oxoacid ferredoxin oxidoreductase subunit beta